MPRSLPIVLASLALFTAACKKDDAKDAAPSASASASAAPTTPAVASAKPAASADPDACPANESWAPKYASATFDWTEKPSLDKAPKDGVYGNVGGGTKTFAIDKVEVWIDKKKKEWTLRANAGPLGPSLMFKGEPKQGATVEEKFSGNRGYYQVPKKGGMAGCFRQTTSYNGDNARVVKLTKLDEKAKTADVVFATTWRESFDAKRQFWAAGTIKGAKVVVFE
jgi:hypothetical protein